MQNEAILNVFPGSRDENRLVLAQATTMCGLKHLVLRQETYSPDVGWFVQNQVAIEPEQVAALKMTLSPAAIRTSTGQTQSTACGTSGVGSNSPRTPVKASPVILQFEATG